MSEQLLLPEEVCEHLRISKRSLRRLIDRGDFVKPTLVGKKMRWDIGALNAWLANGGTIHPAKQPEKQ